MRNYELLYIFRNDMTDTEIKSNFLEVEENILKFGAKKLETLLDHPFLTKSGVSREENSNDLKELPIVKRKFAYPIKNNKSGFYCLFYFSIDDGSKLKEISKYMKMNSNVLRYIITKSDPMSVEELDQLKKLFARKKAEQEKEKLEEKKFDTDKNHDKKSRFADYCNKDESDGVSKIEVKDEKENSEKVLKKSSQLNNIKEKENLEEGLKEHKKDKSKGKDNDKQNKTKSEKKLNIDDLENKLDEILEEEITK